MKDEEMADKHAEEYVMREDVITENDRVPFDNGYGFQTVSFEDEVKKSFKDGFLAGLKEGRLQWHYVKDGDLPKENKDCLVVFHNKYSDNIVKDISRYSVELKKWWFIHDLKDMEEEVIAWKEIVFPELKESE